MDHSDQLEIKTDSTGARAGSARSAVSDWDYLARDCLPGIVLAGAAYPGVMFAIVLLAHTVDGLFTGQVGSAELLVAFLSFALFSFFGAIVGAVLSFFSGLLALSAAWAFNRTLGNSFSNRTCGICAGSLAGYIPTVFAYLTPGPSGMLQVLIGPALAMIVGSLGVYWYAASRRTVEPAKRRFQMSIRHMMVFTAWMAVTFGIAKALGGGEFVWLVGFWGIGQTILMTIGAAILYYRSARGT